MRAAVAAVLLALLLVGTAVAAVSEEEENAPRCHGEQATIVGTDGPDELRGTPSPDVIWGGPGDDKIYGSLGNDVICGEEGADLIHGGRGNDQVDGGAGDHDRVVGDLGDDKATGGGGDYDEVAGDLGIDIVNGGPGDHDLVHGDYGWDRMSGGPGKFDVASFATAVAGGRGSGVWASLETHRSRGDGRDKLFSFENLQGSAFRDTLIGSKGDNTIDGGPGDDTIRGGGGEDRIEGSQGSDGCSGAKGRSFSCGKETSPKASAYVQLNPLFGGGAGIQIVGGSGPDDFVVAFDEASETFGISAGKGIATGPGCTRSAPTQVSCPTLGPALWLTADLGPGGDSFIVEGSMEAVGNVRLAGGYGDDTIRGGPEDNLIEAGPGADKLYGEGGSDGLVGGLPGPTYLYGGPDGDLLAAGGGCAGGALVGGGGRDNASFAETQAHPGTLIISLPRKVAYVDTVRGCDRVGLSPTNEDIEGSFDNDMLIGDGGPNSMLGQPGQDIFIGNGGDDVIDARDGVRDFSIQCGAGRPPEAGKPATGKATGRALMDSFDPAPVKCEFEKTGDPIPGLHG